MSFLRLRAIAVALVLGCAPATWLGACGSSQSTGGNGGDGGGGEDGTTDGTASNDGPGGGDGARGDSGTGDGSQNGDGSTVCVPGCPKDVTCGVYTDCTGKPLVCGMACAKGQVCTSGPNGSQSCQPAPSCSGQCGEIGVDPCGVPITCGGCPMGQTCVANKCVVQPPSDGGTGTCQPLTCNPKNVNLCGTVSDGCGKTLDCTCPMGQQCYGGVCGTLPPECKGADGGAGSVCGSVPNACGSGNVNCGGCTGTTTCTGGTCTSCTPPTCGSTTCGEVSNGCGPKVSCGTCGSGEQCYDGGCCTPSTCADKIDAGVVNGCDPVDLGCGVAKICSPCAGGEVCKSNVCCTPLTCAGAADAGLVTGCNPVDLGCGVMQSCEQCPPGEVCQNNTCVTCTPKTCADFGNTGCGHDDGCGHRIDCCGTGTTCIQNLCCNPGDVVYEGSCCAPQCDTSQPPGPQVSCGVVIYCGNANN
jgi:hypothetical protein